MTRQRSIFDHRMESAIRSTKRSVLVVTRPQFVPSQRFAVAFDGSPAAFKKIDNIARHPLLTGLTAMLVTVGVESPLRLRQRAQAQQTLVKAGFDVHTQLIAGSTTSTLLCVCAVPVLVLR